MKTFKRATIELDIHEAPSTPLSLKLGVIYAPRRRDEQGGGFDGYSCMEVEKGWFVVAGWGRGRTATIWEGEELIRAYHELGTMLGMGQ